MTPDSRVIQGPSHVSESEGEVTRLLNECSSGSRITSEDLLPHVYNQLRAMAQRHLSSERRDHTLQATALVHEAYLRVAQRPDLPWNDRAHFFRAAADSMRRILIDHARARLRTKRGGAGRNRVDLALADSLALVKSENPEDAIALDEAIQRLRGRNSRAADVVHLRFYAGLSVDETALVLGVAPRTVDLDWQFARASLFKALREDQSTSPP